MTTTTGTASTEYSQCPVCDTRFPRSAGKGRKRVYCTRPCQAKQFRHTKSVTKLTETDRAALVEQYLGGGDWRYHKLPAWPRYHCLACGKEINSGSRLDLVRQMVGPAWYNTAGFDEVAGKYRRIICNTCRQPLLITKKRTAPPVEGREAA